MKKIRLIGLLVASAFLLTSCTIVINQQPPNLDGESSAVEVLSPSQEACQKLGAGNGGSWDKTQILLRSLNQLLGSRSTTMEELAGVGVDLRPLGQEIIEITSTDAPTEKAIQSYGKAVLDFGKLLEALPSGEVTTTDENFVEGVVALQDNYLVISAQCSVY